MLVHTTDRGEGLYATQGAPERARWEVIFIHRGKRHRKNFADDLAGALAYYAKALSKGPALKLVTLRCCNMAMPLPAKLRPRTVKRGKQTATITPMRKLNAEGKWWCAWCMRLLPFREGRHGMQCCPLCGAPARLNADNPLSSKLHEERAA